MKVLFCGYRPWAINAYAELCSSDDFSLARSPEELLAALDSETDVVVVAGWSWKVPDEVLENHFVVGMHPSDLPNYSGGSPIQNQILDGVKHTFASMFLLTSKFDEGPLIGKCAISLEGHMEDIFAELTRVTVSLVTDLLERWPHADPIPQAKGGLVVKRLRPDQSRLTKDEFEHMTCSQLFDSIRCREDPYPNVYIEDETGRLYFKRVEFVPK